MKYLRKLIAACALLAMLCPALAEETTYEPLPWLDSTGRKLLAAPYLPNPDCYLPDQGGYHDDSLDIRVETSYWTQDIERVDEPGEGTTTVMAVYVKITDPTQIRTALAFPYPSKNTVRVERMAKQNNAVLAINGDYFIYHSEGIVYRNTHRLREPPLRIPRHDDYRHRGRYAHHSGHDASKMAGLSGKRRHGRPHVLLRPRTGD